MTINHREAALEIIQKLTENSHTAYFAGGYVRDTLMNHTSDDIDIATTASAKEIQSLFPKTIPVGIQFGIIIIVHHDHQFEVATFRKESDYLDGRRPTSITKASPEEDALRRDFTINGMFYDPLEEKLIDYVNGQADIKARVVRAIGDPNQRFLEDRLRMIRAIRYATRFQFDIDPKTRRAILKHADTLFPAVAIERVWQELQKMASYSRFDHSLLALHNHNLLATILPEVKDKDIKDNLKHLPHFPKDAPLIAQLLELFPHYNLAQKLLLCDYFKLSNQERAFVTFYHKSASLLLQELTPYQWVKLYADPHFKISFSLHLAHLTQDAQNEIIALHEKRQQKLLPHIKRYKENDPILKAKHLIEKGYKPGPELGELLKRAEEIAINDNLDSPKEILKKLLG